MVIKSAWVKKTKKKTALKPTSWSLWERVQTGTKTHRKPGIHGEETGPWARGYKRIKNSHVNNIIITRVTVICLKKYRRKWKEQHRWKYNRLGGGTVLLVCFVFEATTGKATQVQQFRYSSVFGFFFTAHFKTATSVLTKLSQSEGQILEVFLCLVKKNNHFKIKYTWGWS